MMENGVSDDHQFSDDDSYNDKVDDNELLLDVLQQRPTLDDSTANVLVIDGIPVVGQDRIGKLKTILEKIVGKLGKINDQFIPEDEDGKTIGYMFVEFETLKQAEDTLNVLNNYKLDKQHTFFVNKFSDLEKYSEVSQDWEPPTPRDYTDHGNLDSWVLNANCIDQFVVMYEEGVKTAIFQNTKHEPTLVVQKENWTDSSVRWSPFGRYISTMHDKGVALWGGEDFHQIGRFPHKEVEYIDFSPCETYLVTYSVPKNLYVEAQDALRIWKVRTGEMVRAFPGGRSSVKTWPYFKWSSNDAYCAFIKGDSLYVYSMPGCLLLDKKSIEIKGIQSFEWSPNGPVFAYWLAEQGQNPARVGLMQIPEKREIRNKNLFLVAGARIHWQKSGDFLCVNVNRYTRKKVDKDGEISYIGVTHNLEIFHMRHKDIPNLSLEHKEPIKALEWEPNGSRFAIVHGDIRSNISVYSVSSAIQLLKTFEAKNQLNALFWAPTGVYCVATGLKIGGSAGPLLFLDTNELSLLQTQEHTGLTGIEWDPTGRFVMTSVSAHGGKGDFGYIQWNFQGLLRQRKPMDRFISLSWRPRPLNPLTEEKKKEIKKNIKKYSVAFDEKDQQSQSKASKEILTKRSDLKEEFDTWRYSLQTSYEQYRVEQSELRDGYDSENDDSDMEEETIEYLIEESEEIIKSE